MRCQEAYTVGGESPRELAGQDVGGEEGLVGIDVPNASDDALVEERGLHGTVGAAEFGHERGGEIIRRRRERIESHRAPAMREIASGVQARQAAEPARVGEGHKAAWTLASRGGYTLAAVELPQHVHMRLGRERGWCSVPSQLPRHAKVHAQHPRTSGGSGDQRQLLAAALRAREGVSKEQRGVEGGRIGLEAM